MGWFLINKKSSKKSRKPDRKGWDPGKTYRVLQGLAALAVLGGIGFAWVWGEQRLRQQVAATAPAKPVTVQLIDVPSWMPRPVADSLQRDLAAGMSTDPFDRQSLQRAAQLMGESPWVKKVHRVS